jgi:hypothetical protein
MALLKSPSYGMPKNFLSSILSLSLPSQKCWFAPSLYQSGHHITPNSLFYERSLLDRIILCTSFKLGSRVYSFYIKDVPNTNKRYKMVLPSHLSPSKLEVLWSDSQFLFCSLDAVQIYKNRSLYFAISLFTLFILAIYYLAVYIHNRLMSLWDHDAFLLYRLEMSSWLLLSSLGWDFNDTTIFPQF